MEKNNMGYYSEIHAQMQEDGELDEENHPTPDEMENNMTTNGEKYENTNTTQAVKEQDRF